MEIIFLNPVFHQMIWGGDRLKTEWGYDIPSDNTGECWGISAHQNGDCTVKGGIYSGIKLSQLWKTHQEIFGNVDSGVFPLIVKIIDAKADLSIQVHPNDEYAFINENGQSGKTESWYILDAPKDATLIIGHNAKDKAQLEDMVKNGRWSDFIREIPVKKGDFIQIAPGTVHAIKGGIEILETQQNCDITYRVYDYGRLQDGKPRKLHIDKSLDVITVPAKPIDEAIINLKDEPKNQLNKLIECDYYKLWKLDVEGSASFEQNHPFMLMSVISGRGLINGQAIKKGDHFIVPYKYGNVDIKGTMEIIASAV
jgi:beta-glucosidase